MVVCKVGFGDGRGVSGVFATGGRLFVDLGFVGACFLVGKRTPLGNVEIGRTSIVRFALCMRLDDSNDGRGPSLTLGLYSYEVRILFIDGRVDWIDGRPSILGLKSRNVSSKAFLIVALSSGPRLGWVGELCLCFGSFAVLSAILCARGQVNYWPSAHSKDYHSFPAESAILTRRVSHLPSGSQM